MAVAQGVFVTLDCADPQPLGEFWAAMLGGEVKFATPTTVAVRTDWMWVAALQVEGYVPPTWPDNEVPKQIHLDLGVTDLEASVAEAQRLGATLTPTQPGDRWRVLLDPAGHPFCLTPAHQWPTGAVLSASKRAAIVAWANERDALIIEDDYDADTATTAHRSGRCRAWLPIASSMAVPPARRWLRVSGWVGSSPHRGLRRPWATRR